MNRGRTIALCVLAVLSSAAGVLWGSQRLLKVTRETVAIKGLPDKLNGMRILHVTDLHSNSREYIRVNIWKRAEELEFDIVALTGDIVDIGPFQIEPHLRYIERLASKYPVFFAEGNHDHFGMSRLRPMLEEAGVTVLLDEKTSFEFNGESFEIVGLKDFYTADFEAERGLFTESEAFRLSLIHQPQHAGYVDICSAPGLVLSGHTHGGQWRVPFLPTLYAPGQGFLPRYGYGLYTLDGAGSVKLFVSKGVGSTGKAPLRIWNRPEICIITLATEENK